MSAFRESMRISCSNGVLHPKLTWAAAVGKGKGDYVKVYLSVQQDFLKNMNSELFFITGHFSIMEALSSFTWNPITEQMSVFGKVAQSHSFSPMQIKKNLHFDALRQEKILLCS